MHMSKTGPPPLRPYQQEALQAMKNYGGTAGLLVMATGLGKTRVFTDYLRWDATENDHHCLILSHREELVKQPLTYLSDLHCGIELGAQHAKGHPHIISASVQSLVGRLDNYNPREIDTIIVDEAHHAVAPTYRKILDYFPGAARFGFTATAVRNDRVGLGVVFDDILIERDTLWGIENGYLTPMECFQVMLKYDMGSVKITADGDYNQKDVARVMSGTAAGVVEAYEKYAQGQTIIYAASVDEAKDITDILNKKAGKQVAALITNTTKNRGRLLEAFNMGVIQVLVNFAVLTEGVDTPCAATILIARPIAPTNIGLYAQMVGRGLRIFPGKKVCRIIDCIGISRMPICTAATLVGKPLTEPKPKTAAAEPQQTESNITLLTPEQVPESWLKSEREVDIMANGVGTDTHNVNWTSMQNGGLVLTIPNVIYRISQPLEDGTVYLRKNKSCSKNPMPMQFILDYVYQDLKQHHSSCAHIWDKEKRHYWDTQGITPQQLNLIRRLAPDVKADAMTRGDASALIQTLLQKEAF